MGFGVLLGYFFVMLLSVQSLAMGGVGVMSRLEMIACFVGFRGFRTRVTSNSAVGAADIAPIGNLATENHAQVGNG
jgi:hypothetical protein